MGDNRDVQAAAAPMRVTHARRALLASGVMLAALSILPAHASETTNSGWTLDATSIPVGGTDPQRAQTTFPSGLQVTVVQTNTLGIQANTGTGIGLGASGAGGTATLYGTANGPTAPAYTGSPLTGFPTASGSFSMWTGRNAACAPTTLGTNIEVFCGNMTVTFSRPVRRPTLHMAQIGGSPADAVWQITQGGTFITSGSNGRTSTMLVSSGKIEPASDVDVACDSTAPSVCGSATINGTSNIFGFGMYNKYWSTRATNTPGVDGFRFQITVDQDFGDAPASYDAGSAASHVLSDLALGTGGTVTADMATTVYATPPASTPLATNGDSDNAFASNPTSVIQGQGNYTLVVPVSQVNDGTAYLCGWIDFNRNGTFDNTNERACNTVASGASSVGLTWAVPTGANFSPGSSYSRFRLGYNNAQTSSPTGPADSGEVEDYPITLVASATLQLEKVWGANSASGDVVTIPATTGGMNNTAQFTSTAATTANSGSPVFVAVGNVVTIPAETGTPIANYATTLTCTGGHTLSGTNGQAANTLTITSANAAVCTYTNTRRSASLVMQKTWTNAALNDGAQVTAARGATVFVTLNSVANTANETDAAAAQTVYAGEAITLAETLTGSNIGAYNASTACTGSAGLSGTTLTVSGSDTAIICTYTNARQQANLAVVKSNGVSSVNGGGSTSYVVTVTNNGPSTVTGAILSDPAATGLAKTAVACGATPGQCVTPPSIAQLEGNSFALPALANGQTYQITVTANINQTSGSVANTANIGIPPAQMDPTPGDNSSTDTDTIVAPAPLTMVKSSQVVSDGVSASNPKAIPGAYVDYTLTITNPSAVTVNNNTVVITDPLPTTLALFVNAISGGSPVVFTANGSGLTFTFTSLSSATDDVEFSNNGGASWGYTPIPNGQGVDSAVTHIRFRPKGTMAASSNFTIRFRTQIK